MRTLLFLALLSTAALTTTSCNRQASTQTSGPMMVSANPTMDEYKAYNKQYERYMKDLDLDDATRAEYDRIDREYRRDLRGAYKGYDAQSRATIMRQMADRRDQEVRELLTTEQMLTYDRMENQLGDARDRFYAETDYMDN